MQLLVESYFQVQAEGSDCRGPRWFQEISNWEVIRSVSVQKA